MGNYADGIMVMSGIVGGRVEHLGPRLQDWITKGEMRSLIITC